jgi:predicted anti-sigma-YlaC factor YlaD
LALIAAVLKKRGGKVDPRPAGRPAGSSAYYAHLDTCRQCREYPFDQCATGAALLRAAADASDRP